MIAKDKPYRKFMILSSPRSGTHMLRTALRNHTNIVARSELFNPDFIKDHPFGPETPAQEILDKYIFRDYPRSVERVGFILHRSGTPFGDWPDLWPMLEADTSLYIISLRRRNLLRRYLSYQVMRTFRGKKPQPLTFDPVTLEKDFLYQEQEVAAFDQRFAQHPLLVIYYEDLCEHYQQTLEQVLNFLRVKPQQIWPDMEGKPQRKLHEAIANFEDLKAYFTTTKWAPFFEDETPATHITKPQLQTAAASSQRNPLLDQLFDSSLFKPYIHYRHRYQESWIGMTRNLLADFFARQKHRLLNQQEDYYRKLPQTGWAFYSEKLEELLIRSFFQDRRNGFFLDVGCAWPVRHSNTFYLERHLGWTGIAIDAGASNKEGWQKYRPGSQQLTYLVGDETGKMQAFYRAGGLGSTQEERTFGGKTIRGEKTIVPTITLTDLLQERGIEKIDFISIDVEHYEVKVLAGFDIERFQPELVCIEVYHENRAQVLTYFEKNHYEYLKDFRYWDKTNLYFVPKDN